MNVLDYLKKSEIRNVFLLCTDNLFFVFFGVFFFVIDMCLVFIKMPELHTLCCVRKV